MYKITITLNDGTIQVTEDSSPDFYLLTRAIDKCQIKAFTVTLSDNIM